MRNTDPLLETAREIMSRELSSRPVLRSGSISEKRLKSLFISNSIEDLSGPVTDCIAESVKSSYLRTTLPISTLPLSQKALK